MHRQKFTSTFIRYYRIIEVTLLGSIIGGLYGLILYYTNISAVSGLIPSIVVAGLVGLVLAYSVNAFEFLVLRRLMRQIPPSLVILVRIVSYSLFSILWIAFAYFLLYLLKEKIPISLIADKFSENKKFRLVIGGSVIMTMMGMIFYQLSLLQSRNGLINYLLGRYSKPQRIKRIFMFLDLKGSTSHAESLGDLKFSSLLQDCFFDLQRPVHETAGDVYQYIGDEAVLVWKYGHAQQNFRCIQCFLSFRDALKKRSEYYISRYGFVPDFKAGLHGGEVVVVRVGEIKKEIAYHGDVLNTTARLESLCNQLQTPLVISGNLLQNIELPDALKFEVMPSVQLRGKEQSVEVFRWVDA